MNLREKQGAINAALNSYLIGKSIKCPVFKYGINPAAAKTNIKDNSTTVYPYMQSYVSNVKEQSWTTRESGIYTRFDYQLSFFTAPETEFGDDTKLFYPFEVARNALSDIQLNILNGIAVIKRIKANYKADMKSGQLVPSAFVIYEMAAVCSYEAITPSVGQATNIDEALIIKT